MKTVICYVSRHHGNTKKVLDAMKQVGDVELIEIKSGQKIDLTPFDAVGLASGIYFGAFHQSVLHTAQQYLPEGKPVFFVCTYGARRPGYTRQIANIAQSKGCPVWGTFTCRGFDTFGPFRLIGGIAKGHPNEKELEKARAFYVHMQETGGKGENT